MKNLFLLILCLSLTIKAGAQQRPKPVIRSKTIAALKGIKSIYLSAHAPMWSARIDVSHQQFVMTADDGTEMVKQVRILSNPSSKGKISIVSADTLLRVILIKNCDCPYDIPEQEAAQWQAILLLNHTSRYGCAYFQK